MVEGARLESVYTGNGIAGSNPALSACARRSPKHWGEGGLRHPDLPMAGFGGRGPLLSRDYIKFFLSVGEGCCFVRGTPSIGAKEGFASGP